MTRALGSPVRALCRSVLFALAFAALAPAAASAASAAEKPLPALTPAPRDALTRALGAGRLTEAEYALERGRSLFRLANVRRRFGAVDRLQPRDATLVLRDLALRLRFLSGEQRAQAERILARPTDGRADPQGQGYTVDEVTPPLCGADICFHWVATTPDAPRPTDSNVNGTPDWVETTKEVFETVWSREIGLGYREPLSDVGTHNDGGDARLDVYLADLGNELIFGYCAADPQDSGPTDPAVPVYCVVDDDFKPSQYFSSHTARELLDVTAAHEFFHAVQAAYDFREDIWLIEGTAMNMEETVYPSVNDNIAYLDSSQLRHPAVPLDRGGFRDTEYGAWIWWRYLEEKAFGGDPTVIRHIWERADASALAAYGDQYSLQATNRTLLAAGKSLPDEYAAFAVANRLRDYADGPLYPRTPTVRSFSVGLASPSTGWQSPLLNHLSTRYFSFKPGTHVSSTARLRLDVDLTFYGARATLVSYARSGTVTVRPIALGRGARGRKVVPFGRGTINRVDLVLANGSSRTRCFTDLEDPPFYSCHGTPRDERRTERFRALLR